jgi:hypothetical protein
MTGTEKTGVKDHPNKTSPSGPRKGRQMLLRGFSFSPDQPEGHFRLISETTPNDPNSLNGGVTYTRDEVGNRTSTLPPAARPISNT